VPTSPRRSTTRCGPTGSQNPSTRSAAPEIDDWGNNYASGGKECDEIPFATTYQGAAQALLKYDPQQKAPKNNFSARPHPQG